MTAWEIGEDRADLLAEGTTGRAAHAVLWHYDPRPGVQEPGDFVKSLVTTIARADPGNRLRLALGFPAHVMAVELVNGRSDGVARLRAIAGLPPLDPPR